MEEKKYYKSIEELTGLPATNSQGNTKEEGLIGLLNKNPDALTSNRRNFLKLFGFSVTSAAVLASCEQPVRKAIPYLIKPEEVTPGKASYYATSWFDGNNYNSILAKVRDGRPIKIEGNDLSFFSQGSTNARTQASVLNLYDTARYQKPYKEGKETDWTTVDEEIIAGLKKIKSEKGKIAILSSTIISPSTLAVIDEFKKSYPGTVHIQYDAISASGILEANKLSFNKQVIPYYHFDKAELIVSFNADFLGSWLAPTLFTKQYSKGRKLDENQNKLSKHIQFEGGMSLTGSNADERIIIKPSQEKEILTALYNEIANKTGKSALENQESPVDIKKLADELLHKRTKSLVVSGSNDADCQIIVNAINHALGNYGSTIDLNTPLLLKKGIDAEMENLVDDMVKGKVDALITYNANPLYNYPDNTIITEAFKNVPLTISLADLKEETAEASKYICPDNYYLENWNDFEPVKGKYSLSQPVIRPIFNTRSAQESLLTWSGNNTPYVDFLKNHWEKKIYPKSNQLSFFNFWTKCVHDGIFEITNSTGNTPSLSNQALQKVNTKTNSGEFEVILYENVSVGDGKNANNPWLQELPDPVSKVCWDNYAAISPKLADEKGLKNGNLVKINGISFPVLIQPGQEYKTISIALGYGRTKAGKVADNVGVNAYVLIKKINESRSLLNTDISFEPTVGSYELAMTQTHHSMEGRAIIRETTLDEYKHDKTAGNHMHEKIEHHHMSLYNKKEFKGHHWGMAVDLNSCTGCNACVVGCSAENNVPVVGKEEVLRVHEMHWIRIDRYYNGDINAPEVVRQPVMCQHCDNAPCENVCPVAATNHSDEGINQMAYNRCIGTRYCNNNCPYKVRRFNWYDYTTADAIKNNTIDPAGMTVDLRRMVLNPDVTVRAKGVIEKCSFCVQRIQENKLTAKLENRPLRDGELKTACQQACPANAITFGDLNDENSKVTKLFADERNYHLLEELHTLPSVGYLTKVRNIKPADDKPVKTKHNEHHA